MHRYFFVFFIVLLTWILPPCSLSQVQDDDFVQRSEKAEIFFQRRDYKSAYEIWSALLTRVPPVTSRRQAFSYLERSKCSIYLREDSLALDDVTASLARFPTADAYFVRSGIYARQKLNSSALEDIEKAIQIVPDNGEYYLLRGNIRFQIGDKAEGCSDIAMAKTLGIVFPNDIANKACEYFTAQAGGSTKDSSVAKVPPKASNTVADASMQTLLQQTNNLNTGYHLLSIQAIYGRTATMLSRLFFDTEAGTTVMLNIGIAPSREFSFWVGWLRSFTPYTFGSERSQVSPNAAQPFGSVISTLSLVGGRYSLPMGNAVDVQLDGGIGYKHTSFPTDVPIPFNDGSIRRANLGIRESTGLALQTSVGIEWRIFKQIALTGNILFGLSFAPYNFLTLGRVDRETMHQFLSYSGGIRFYLFERNQ